MQICIAGAMGVPGRSLVPLLVQQGHTVAEYSIPLTSRSSKVIILIN
jgi:hypothetical protein